MEGQMQHKPNKPTLKWLRIFLYILLSFLLLLAGIMGYVWSNQDEIKQHLLTQLNKTLHTQISIRTIGIDFYHNFPQISLDLENLEVKDAFNSKEPLLAAKHMYIGFNIWDIMNKHYRVRKLNIDSGRVHIFISKAGKANYQIFTSDSTSTNETFVYLESVALHQILATYDDRYHKQYNQGFINHINLGLTLEKQAVALTCNGTLQAHELRSGNIAWIKDKAVELNMGFTYNYSNSRMDFKNSFINIETLPLILTGTITNKEKHTDIDIAFDAKQTNIPALLALIPFKITLTDGWQSNGKASFAGNIKGKLSDKNTPDMNISFEVQNGSLQNKQTDVQLNQVECKGLFRYAKGDGIVKLEPFSFRMKNSTFKGSLQLSELNDMKVEANVNCHADGNELLRLIGSEIIENAGGTVDARLTCAGRVKDLIKNAASVKSSGTIRVDLKDIAFKNRKETIEKLQAAISLNGPDVVINMLTATLNKSDIELSGELRQVYAYLFDKKELIARLTYHSGYIDLQQFYVPATAGESTALALPERISLQAAIKVDALDYDRFKATQIGANLVWSNGQLTLSDLTAQTMEGTIKGNMQLLAAADGRYMISGKTNLAQVNITELFKQCNNFSQAEITDKNLKGILNCDAEIVSVWSKSWECDLDKFYMVADVAIKNGEIIQYDPLKNLSRFANVEDLRNLKFASLNNKIEIRGKTIYIPEMDILSNAMNITLAGTHTFSNYLDYRLKIKLSELLKKKRKPAENEFGEEEENGKGLSLFLTMKGPAGDLTIAYDKIGVKQKVKQDLRNEKENIKEILKKELGIGKDTSIKEKESNTEELEFEQE